VGQFTRTGIEGGVSPRGTAFVRLPSRIGRSADCRSDNLNHRVRGLDDAEQPARGDGDGRDLSCLSGRSYRSSRPGAGIDAADSAWSSTEPDRRPGYGGKRRRPAPADAFGRVPRLTSVECGGHKIDHLAVPAELARNPDATGGGHQPRDPAQAQT
jgi:hypothetical protein